jgi:hypothetical protein
MGRLVLLNCQPDDNVIKLNVSNLRIKNESKYNVIDAEIKNDEITPDLPDDLHFLDKAYLVGHGGTSFLAGVPPRLLAGIVHLGGLTPVGKIVIVMCNSAENNLALQFAQWLRQFAGEGFGGEVWGYNFPLTVSPAGADIGRKFSVMDMPEYDIEGITPARHNKKKVWPL